MLLIFGRRFYVSGFSRVLEFGFKFVSASCVRCYETLIFGAKTVTHPQEMVKNLMQIGNANLVFRCQIALNRGSVGL
jgi:hypothetical protein